MKKISLFLIIIIIALSCKKEKRTAIASVVNEELSLNNEVVLIAKDSINPFSINFINHPFQLNPERMVLGKERNEIAIINTDSLVKIVCLNNYRYRINHTFKKGDSVYVTHKDVYIDGKEKVEYPYFTVSNRKVNSYELNFDFYVSLKTPTLETFAFYDHHNRFLNRNKSKSSYIKIKYSFNDVCKNVKSTLDSFYKAKLVSSSFFKTQSKLIEISRSNTEIWLANKNRTNLNLDKFEISLTDTILVDNELYLSYLRGHIYNRYFLNKKKHVNIFEQYDFIIKNDTFLNKTLKEAILNNYLRSIYKIDKTKFVNRYVKFKSISQNKNYINYFEFQIENDKKDKEFETTLKNATGKLVKLNSAKKFDFQNVIANNNGKVILVDFWASWCAPCRKEMPSLKKLQKEIDTSKLVVISISTDKSVSAWEKASVHEGLNKTLHNYLLVNAEESSLMKDFKIKTIPRYLLYDKNGVLVDSNAPRPSNEKKIRKLLNNYIKG